MLHFVLEPEPHDRLNLAAIVAVGKLRDEARHLLVDMRAIFLCLSDGWARTRSPLRSLNAHPKSFVIRVEIEQKFVRINFVSWLILLQHGLEKPGGVADMPTRRTHELRRLDYIVFDFQRRDNFERAGTHTFIEVGDGLCRASSRLLNL